ncbi:TetR/AcrR family transcriptional regulator [Chryseomicrobium aureum]|uniref:TetR/AcrR family transcriptional regulator n=1 Tax=Chryseomicrobium aureum TaxID=1441723 RepID=UPI00370DDA4C
MDGYKQRTTKKKQAILLATEQLLIEKQSSVTIQDIAKQAGVSPVSIYNYFGSKEQVILRAIEDMVDRQLKRVEAAFEDQDPFAKVLEDLLTLKIQSAQMLDATLIEQIIHAPEFQLWAKQGMAAFENLVQYGKEQGAISQQLSTERFMRYAQVMQDAIMADILKESRPLEEAMQDYFEFFLYGLVQREDPSTK